LTIVVQTYIVFAVPGTIAQRLKQTAPFSSQEQEVFLGVLVTAARIIEPWTKFLKASAELTTNQYNVLRILRGSHPTKLTCGDISERMIARDPDVTRLVDRLARRGLVQRSRSRRDRRVVEVGITDKGVEVVRGLDPHVERMPKAVLGHLGGVRLRQLRSLLDVAIADMGTFP
jgi:DNA-binding MarR family transcriptional regulator